MNLIFCSEILGIVLSPNIPLYLLNFYLFRLSFPWFLNVLGSLLFSIVSLETKITIVHVLLVIFRKTFQQNCM